MFSKKARATRIKKISKSSDAGVLRTTATDTSITKLDHWSQLRRCHRCGSLHEQRGERVVECADCGAHFAPYFYAELTPDALQLGAPESLVTSGAKPYRALVGISWWWCDATCEDLDSGESMMPRA